MDTMRSLEEIVDIERLQRVQDDFANALDMAFIIVDYKGVPIVNYSGFTDFCMKTRQHAQFLSHCYECDAHGGLQAAITGKPHIYYCHMGLTDFAVPLMVDGKYCGAVLGGQIYSKGNGVEDLHWNIETRSCWEDDEELVKAREKIKTLSLDKINSALNMIRATVQVMFQKGYEERVRAEIAEKIKKPPNRGAVFSSVNADFIFSNLSLISGLAYLEQADRTADAIFSLADILRYSLGCSSNQISYVKDEIEYVRKYLTLEKIRLGEKFTYHIDFPECYANVACPSMIIKPIVENAITYTVDSEDEGGEIQIVAADENDELVISITDKGKGIPQAVIDNIMDERFQAAEDDNRYDLYQINRNLRNLFGRRYKLEIDNNTKGFGTIVKVRIPMSGDTMR